MERDRLELQEIKRRIPPPMLQYYLQVCCIASPACKLR